MRRWGLALLAVLAVLDLAVLGFGLRAREGDMPPAQRRSAEFTAAAGTPSASADPATDTGIHAPLLLGVNESGVVLRATRGACEARFDDPAKIWVGNIDGGADLDVVELPELHEVLGLFVAGNGSMRLSGLDETCEPVTYESSDEGATWQPATVSGLWRLDSDTSALSLTGPAGASIPVTCAPVQIVNLPGRRGVASCDTSTFFVLRAGRAPDARAVAAYTNLSVTTSATPDHHYVLGSTDACGAQVADLGPVNNDTDTRECLGDDRAPLAIATSRNRVVVQVGDDLMVSTNDGQNFTPVVPDAATSSS